MVGDPRKNSMTFCLNLCGRGRNFPKGAKQKVTNKILEGVNFVNRPWIHINSTLAVHDVFLMGDDSISESLTI